MTQNSNEDDLPTTPEGEDQIRLIADLLTTVVKNQESQQAWMEHLGQKLDTILDHLAGIR